MSAVETAPADLEASTEYVTENAHTTVSTSSHKQLPLQCPGCGAFSQTVHADQPGFFDLGRQSTMAYLGLLPERTPRIRQEDKVVQQTIRRLELSHGGEDVQLRSLLMGPVDAAEKAEGIGRSAR